MPISNLRVMTSFRILTWLFATFYTIWPAHAVKEITKFLTREDESIAFITNQDFPHLRVIGSGSFSIVCEASNDSGQKMAVKRIAFSRSHYDRRKILRELSFLDTAKHPNVLSLVRFTLHTDQNGYVAHVWTAFFDHDLYSLMKSRPLSNDAIKSIMYQIAGGLNYLHSMNVVHRDLKPQNILVDGALKIRIGDLGLARVILDTEDDHQKELSNYVVTRWYRAPEVLDKKKYGAKIDIWAAGCIFAELKLRRPLLAGKNSLEQRAIINGFALRPSRHIPQYPEHGGSLLVDMLSIDPDLRPSATEMLQNPYFEEIICSDTEQIFEGDIVECLSLESKVLNTSQFLAEITAISAFSTGS